MTFTSSVLVTLSILGFGNGWYVHKHTYITLENILNKEHSVYTDVCIFIFICCVRDSSVVVKSD